MEKGAKIRKGDCARACAGYELHRAGRRHWFK